MDHAGHPLAQALVHAGRLEPDLRRKLLAFVLPDERSRGYMRRALTASLERRGLATDVLDDALPPDPPGNLAPRENTRWVAAVEALTETIGEPDPVDEALIRTAFCRGLLVTGPTDATWRRGLDEDAVIEAVLRGDDPTAARRLLAPDEALARLRAEPFVWLGLVGQAMQTRERFAVYALHVAEELVGRGLALADEGWTRDADNRNAAVIAARLVELAVDPTAPRALEVRRSTIETLGEQRLSELTIEALYECNLAMTSDGEIVEVTSTASLS